MWIEGIKRAQPDSRCFNFRNKPKPTENVTETDFTINIRVFLRALVVVVVVVLLYNLLFSSARELKKISMYTRGFVCFSFAMPFKWLRLTLSYLCEF